MQIRAGKTLRSQSTKTWLWVQGLTVSVEMKDEELRYFENLCNMLYGPSSQQEKQKADEELTKIMKNPSFANDVEYFPQLFT